MPYERAHYAELSRERALNGRATRNAGLNPGLLSTLKALLHEGEIERTEEAVRRRLGLSDTPKGRALAADYLNAATAAPSGPPAAGPPAAGAGGGRG